MMMSNFLAISLLVLLGSLIALIGGLIFIYVKPWSRFLSRYSASFAAGVLLTVALLGLIPEASHLLGENAYVWVLGAFLGSYIFENLACSLHHHHNDESCSAGGEAHGHNHGNSHGKKSALSLIVVGDTIHNFIDGATIAAAYLVNPGLGVVTAVSTFLHEVPHEIGDFGVLIHAGWEKRKVILVNLVSALFSFAGAYLIFFFPGVSNILGYLLAISAGMFLYLGASDFLPHANDNLSPKKSMIVLLTGVLIMYLVINLVPHS